MNRHTKKTVRACLTEERKVRLATDPGGSRDRQPLLAPVENGSIFHRADMQVICQLIDGLTSI